MPRKPKQAAQAEPQSAQPGNLAPEAQQLVEEFRGRYPFPLDPFQEEAIAHLAAGESVMVAAPTLSKFAGGCRLNQDTERTIQEADFQIERIEQGRGLLPMNLVWARTEA